jgi:DNA-binding IclR family transcriptional regulator
MRTAKLSDAKPAAARKTYAAPALSKGLDVLELLAGADEPLSARVVAERLGRSKNELFRMIHVLVERGYVAREAGSDRLVLTRRLFELGVRTPRPRRLVEVAAPAMEALSEELRQSVHLVVLMRGETVVVATASGGDDLSLTLRLGYRRPALEATSGLLIVAFQPEARRARLAAEAAAAAGRPPPGSELEARLARIRDEGALVADSHDVVGVTDIGCPILGPDGAAAAALVVPYLNRHGATPLHRVVRERLAACCEAIGAALR